MTRVMLTVAVLATLVLPARAQEVTEYYGTDALGSVRVVFDATGTVVGRTDYVPFGDALNPSGALPPEQFTGQERHGDAGLDYFGARYYAARFGRFSTVDPIGGHPADPQSWNRYAYARNAPGTFVDPTGMQGCVPSPGVNFCTGVTETLPREASSGAIGLPLGGVFLWAGWDDWFETEKKQNGWDDHLNYVWEGNRAVRAWYPDAPTESSGGDGVLDAIEQIVDVINAVDPTPVSSVVSVVVNVAQGDGPGLTLVAAGMFIPPLDALRAGKGLIAPGKFFGSKNAVELSEMMTRKFGSPRSLREGAETYFNVRTGRSFNIHTDPTHGAPHVDIRRRGGYPERKYPLGQ